MGEWHITEQGVYQLPEDEYHADPVEGGSLSSSGAKLIADCPAKFKWQRDNPPPPKHVYDFGSAAHREVLGTGPDICVIDADNWRTKQAKADAAEARDRGEIPILKHEHETVVAMADALRRDPVAGVLLNPEHGQAEQTLVWEDTATGVTCRALVDWLTEPLASGTVYVPDYKTAYIAQPGAFGRNAARYRYHWQGDWYLDGVETLGLDGDKAIFLFIVQEKDPPYVVQVYQLPDVARRAAAIENRRARERYVKCVETGEWPGYSTDIEILDLPRWAL